MLLVGATNIYAGKLTIEEYEYVINKNDEELKEEVIEININVKNRNEIDQGKVQEVKIEEVSEYVDISDYKLILVNKDNYLKDDFIPKELRKVKLSSAAGKNMMTDDAATALEKMFTDAKIEGHNLYAGSGYRSYERQKTVFNNNVKKHGKEKAETFSAPPGSSEHQTGLAMDISSKSMGYGFEEMLIDLPEGKWVNSNAWKYGFIIRYPKDKTHITKYTYEPWHVRYVGGDVAKEIHEKGYVLEEYIELKKQIKN